MFSQGSRSREADGGTPCSHLGPDGIWRIGRECMSFHHRQTLLLHTCTATEPQTAEANSPASTPDQAQKRPLERLHRFFALGIQSLQINFAKPAVPNAIYTMQPTNSLPIQPLVPCLFQITKHGRTSSDQLLASPHDYLRRFVQLLLSERPVLGLYGVADGGKIGFAILGVPARRAKKDMFVLRSVGDLK